MTIALLVISLILLLAGAFTLTSVGTVMEAGRRLTKRRVDSILPEPPEPSAGRTDKAGARTGVLWSIIGAGVRISWEPQTPVFVLIVSSLVVGVFTWLVLAVAIRLPIWIWAPGTVVAFLLPPRFLLRLEQARMEARFLDVFPDAIDMMVRMLRAGLPMSAAIRIVGAEAAPPVNGVFAKIAEQMSIGVSFDGALVEAGKRIRLPDFRFFAVAASLQQATGGNLASTLEILSEIIRKRRAGRMKAKAVTSEVRMSAYVLAAIPFVIIGGLMLLRPSYLEPLITDRRGNVIIAMATFALLSGFFIMRQMMQSVTRI